MIGPEPELGRGERLRPSDTILVALDGSLPAQAAASIAIQLAQAEGLAIRGLYVVDERLVMDPYARADTELGAKQGLTSRPDLIARFMQRGDAVLRWLEVSCREASVPVSTDLLLGAVPELVLGEGAKSRLLAMGRRGLGHGADTRHLGRNLRAIARHATRPMLIGGDERRPVRRLLLVYEPGRRNQEALAWAVVFQRMLASPAIVLAPPEDGAELHRKFSETEMQERLEASSLSSYRLVRWDGSLGDTLVAIANEDSDSLIVAGQHHRTILHRSRLGAMLDEVLRRSGVPALLA